MDNTITCPSCGEEVNMYDIEQRKDRDLPVTVARRQTGFSGNITSLLEMKSFAYMIELPCGCEVLTVN